jgi:hypothetical protein
MQRDDGFVTSRNNFANYMNNIALCSIVVYWSLSLYTTLGESLKVIFHLSVAPSGGDFETISKNTLQICALQGHNAASKCR